MALFAEVYDSSSDFFFFFNRSSDREPDAPQGSNNSRRQSQINCNLAD